MLDALADDEAESARRNSHPADHCDLKRWLADRKADAAALAAIQASIRPITAAAGDYHRAADALRRAASHTATVAATHWHQLKGTRRRLQSALNDLASKWSITYTQAGIFRQVYELPRRIKAAVADAPTEAAGQTAVVRLLRRTRTRIRRLLKYIAAAMAADPSPRTFEQILADIAAGRRAYSYEEITLTPEGYRHVTHLPTIGPHALTAAPAPS